MAELNIKTSYWKDGKCVRTNSSTNLSLALRQCAYHMRENTYRGAYYAEVYDSANGNLLHMQVKRSPATGKTVIYERNPQEQRAASKFAAIPFLKSMR